MITIDHEALRRIVKAYGRLPVDVDTLSEDEDLYLAGMTSHASVSVMLAVEDAFAFEFPDDMLTRGVFGSINSMAAAVASLLGNLEA